MDDSKFQPTSTPCPGGAILAELLATSREMSVTINSVNGILRSHMHDHESNQRKLESIVKSVRTEVNSAVQGFPDGDPIAHRSHHESEIERMKTRAEFWKKMTFELSKWGLMGFIAWSVYSLWISFLHGPK